MILINYDIIEIQPISFIGFGGSSITAHKSCKTMTS